MDLRKVALIGCGMVGMSFAYAALCRGVCDTLVLIDLDTERAQGEAADLCHALPFASSSVKIAAGDYDMAADADIAVICAGVAQREGEDRIALLARNAKVVSGVTESLMRVGFSGIILVATNPVDLMSMAVWQVSGMPEGRILGTGTTLDSARLRYLLGAYFNLDPRNVHAYVIGEHGDSEFVPWSQAMLSTKPVLTVCRQFPERFKTEDLARIEDEVRHSAGQIIAAKGATYYGIGMSICRIVAAIFGNESSVLTVSALHRGTYGLENVFCGTPCVVGREGVLGMVELDLTAKELRKLKDSADFLRETYLKIKL